MIIVLINDTVKKYLLKQPKDTRKRIRDKFEFLETGIWDGGLKVKKLKGVSGKYIFEARLDRGNRILFTLGASAKTDPTGNRLIVYVWGIVAHDDVSLKSLTIIPDNAPFLQFREYDETHLEEVDMEELGPAYFTQEAITERTGDESGSQRWYRIDEPEWRRIQMYTRDDFDLFLHLTPEQDEILGTPLPLMISGTAGSGKTSLAVYYLLNRNLSKKKKLFITYNKHLKNFARKLYNGLLNEREWKKEVLLPDFYTFKELCLEVAGKERFHPGREVDLNRFSRLFTTYPGYQSYDAAPVWEEIRAVIKGAVPRVNLPVLETALQQFKKGTLHPGVVRQLQEQFILFSKLESFQRVDKFVQKYLKIDIGSFAADIRKYLQAAAGSSAGREKEGVAAILERTRNMLKKDRQDNGRQYLSLDEYEILGKKKAPNFKFNRKDIYRIFQWYQDKLETANLWDELDMVPGTVPNKYTYDILVCDEIQDLTDTQLDLLFNFVKNPNNMFLAGDTRQTINPSGFRWEEVRKHFYERGLEVPELKNLSLNFRSSGSIVELANTLLELKETFTGKKSDEPKEAWKYKGRPVTVVTDVDLDEMLNILRTPGAERTILVRTEAEKELLKDRLHTELVFTIKEAKGLEFDTVVLWKFCEELPEESDKTADASRVEDVWKAILAISDKNVHEARIRHEISLLYVGITRCQKDLVVYDGIHPSVIWESQLLKENVYITNDRRYLEKVWNVITLPDQWVEQGHYFFERGYFRAAAECYKNGADTQNLAKADAHYHEQTGNYSEAALNFEIIGETRKAAVNYENAGQYQDALSLWEQLNDGQRVSQCRAALLEGEDRFREAGELYLKIKNYRAAVASFNKAKNPRAAADIYLHQLNNIEKAAQHYEYAREYPKAAELYTRLEWYDKAAELYFRDKNYPEAEVLWEKTGNKANLLELYRRTGNYKKTLLIYEEEDNLEKAVRYLKTLKMEHERLMEEGEELLQNRAYYQALVRFLVVQEALPASDAVDVSGKIAQCYDRMGQYKESIPYYEKARQFYTAAQVYEKVGDHESAFRLFFDLDQDKADDFARTRQVLEKVTNPGYLKEMALGKYFEEDYERALFLFNYLGGFEPLKGLCYALREDNQKAVEQWERCRHYGEFLILADGCLEKDLIAVGSQFFLDLPFRSGAFEPATFSADLDKTPIAELMRGRFRERIKDTDEDEGKQEDEETLETRIREKGIWGHFILREDERFINIKLVLHYLAQSGNYNSLLKHYRQYRRTSPKKYDKMLETLDKDMPHKTSTEESLAFKRILLHEQGKLKQKEIADLNKRLPRVTISHKNYGLFLAKVIKEETRQKAVAWCKKNGFKKELKEYCL